MFLRIATALGARAGLRPPYVVETILDRAVSIPYGMLGERADYDYGWMYALIADSRVFVDAGCSLGIMSLVGLLENDVREVVLVDAGAEALSIAAGTLIRNGFANRMRAVQAFISDRDDDVVQFFTVRGGAAGSRFASHAVTAAREGKSDRVATLTLDSIVASLAVVPDLIKLDIEGAEIEALAGAAEVSRSMRPRWCVEMHSAPDRPMRDSAARVLEYCATFDYRAFYLKHHVEMIEPDAIAHRGRCHLLLLPKEQPYPAMLAKIRQGASFDDARRVMEGPR